MTQDLGHHISHAQTRFAQDSTNQCFPSTTVRS
jgi:hypothetical protein